MADDHTLSIYNKTFKTMIFQSYFPGSTVANEAGDTEYSCVCLFVAGEEYADDDGNFYEYGNSGSHFNDDFWTDAKKGALTYQGRMFRLTQDGLTGTSDTVALTPGEAYRFGILLAEDMADPVKVGNSYTYDYTGLKYGFSLPLQNPSIPSKWSWEKSNGQASKTLTVNAHDAVTGNGYCKNFSYLVWNDMVNKVLEIMRGYCARYDADSVEGNTVWPVFTTSSGTSFLNYGSTKMTSTDKVMTAKRFNSIIYRIDEVNRSEEYSAPSYADAGDAVLGEYFIEIANAINGAIDTIK